MRKTPTLGSSPQLLGYDKTFDRLGRYFCRSVYSFCTLNKNILLVTCGQFICSHVGNSKPGTWSAEFGCVVGFFHYRFLWAAAVPQVFEAMQR